MTRPALTILLIGCAITLLAFNPNPALSASSDPRRIDSTEAIESLQRQLAAQKAINAQLHARVRELEQRLALSQRDTDTLLLGLDASAPPPPIEPEPTTTAIEEALVNKGLVLLPTGAFRFTPSLAWSHNGSGYAQYDSVAYGMKFEAGLPWGMSASLQLPYIQRNYPAGRNDGVGDLSFSLSKRLTGETETLPSTVLRLSYQHDNGEDAFDPIPIGYGLRVATATLSAVKRLEPIALYGNLSYSHAWPKTLSDPTTSGDRVAEIDPADIYGLGLGVSLAATPTISLNLDVSVDVLGSDMITTTGDETYKTGLSTVGYINLGADLVLRKDLALSLSAAVGVTDNANDFVFSLALPYRF